MWTSDSSSMAEDSRSDEDIVINEEDEDSTSQDNIVKLPEENLKSADKQQWSPDQETHSVPKGAAKKMKLMQWVQRPMVNTRSVTRRLYSEGCVLVRPTPEDAMELREWPAEGMHERPVWPDPRYEIPTPPISELELILHHSFHAVLGYVLQCAQLFNIYQTSGKELKKESEHLYELVLNTGLLYCMVNSVSQNDLAAYISSLTTETVSEWLQEMY